MILRVMARLVGFLLMLAVGFLLARVLRTARSTNRGTEAQEPGDVRTPMVRDRVCNTFLPRSRALARTIGGSEHFFCSEGCLRVFLERPVAQDRV